ncbi:pre-rRNA processing protein Esf1 [Phyllosticta capitalensis]
MPKPSKQKAPKGKGNAPKPSGSTISDPRFSNMTTDPRFRLPSKKNNRVTLDKRFAHMLKDDDFSKKASVDRYGRKVSKNAGKKELERIYRVEDEDEDEDEEADQSDEADDDDEVQRELARIDRKYDPARDGGFSSSSDDDSDDDDDSDEADVSEDEAVEFPNNGNDPQVDELDEPTTRIAVVNLDWDNIRATDLMAVASSFVPAEGRISKVTVYPSEFGRERMEREELEGPPREIFSKNKRKDDSESDEDSDSEDERIKQDLLQEDKGEEFDSKALRQYQLERLRYYYALIECDSAATAKYLYDNMDGREYLSSANFFDMRFVPDEVSFEEDKPRDECSRIPDGYKPNEFVTDALTHSKVKLTWDADDTTRKEVQKRAFSQKEIDENDLKAYIGTDSSDDEESDEALSSGDEAASTTTHDKKAAREEKAAKLRAALGLSSGSLVSKKKKSSDGPVGDMQITFTSGLSNKSKDDTGKGVFENAPEETTREKYIRKEKERKQRRKERARAARTGAISDEQAAEQDAASDAEASAAEEDAHAPGPDDDDPFNDPFFTDPAGETQRAAKAAKKAAKQKNASERAAAAEAAAAERAQLELLMADEGADAKLKHFDMKAIEKAEKEARRKGKGKKNKTKKNAAADDANGEEQSGFSMDTADPRFKAVFDSHEYAIDPTNPRFKRTQGMTALLEEGRRKRKDRAERDDVDAPVERGAPAGKKAKRSAAAADEGPPAGGDDLKKLVEKVKSKTAARKGKA